MDWFTKNLTTHVKCPVTRGSIWQNFWILVIEKKMSSLKFMDFVIINLPLEDVEENISTGLSKLSVLVNNYIPVALVKSSQQKMFDTLLQVLKKDPPTKDPIVDALFGFIAGKAELEMCLEWLKQGEIKIEGKVVFKLQKKQKHSIIAHFFKSEDFSLEFKLQLLETTLADDKSDIAVNTRARCMAGLPDPENKAKTWAEITDTTSKESLYVRTAKISGFYSYGQIE